MSSLVGNDLYLIRGSSIDITIRIASGNNIDISSITAPNIVTTSTPHCLTVGDEILVIVPNNSEIPCDTSYCETVATVTSDTVFTVNNFTASANITASGGYVSRSANLNGFRLHLSLQPPSRKSLGLVQTEAGNKLILVQGSCQSCCDSCGTTLCNGLTIEVPDVVTGNLVGHHQVNDNCCVLMLDTAASVSTKSALAFIGEASPVEFTSTTGFADCGILNLRTSPSALASYGGCYGGSFSPFGTYNLSLQRAWSYPSRYNRSDFVDWSASLRSGVVYIRS